MLLLLQVNKTVTNVNMDRNLIREEGTLAFAAALKSPTSALRLLNLESTYGRERGLAAVYSALEVPYLVHASFDNALLRQIPS